MDNPTPIKKKKLFLLGDDLRMHSGISTMSREIVLGTAHHYDWVTLGCAIKHPETGKIIDISAAVNKEININDAYVKIYPMDGYGNEQVLFSIIEMEKPDALVFFTDPRYWGWLFALENQVRQKIPMIYYNIWDSTPFPYWNRSFYQSCDALLSISKQTYNINKWVLRPENCVTMNGSFNEKGDLI